MVVERDIVRMNKDDIVIFRTWNVARGRSICIPRHRQNLRVIVKELYVLRTRNLRKPVYWFFRSKTQINQKWAKVLLRETCPLFISKKFQKIVVPRVPLSKKWHVHHLPDFKQPFSTQDRRAPCPLYPKKWLVHHLPDFKQPFSTPHSLQYSYPQSMEPQLISVATLLIRFAGTNRRLKVSRLIPPHQPAALTWRFRHSCTPWNASEMFLYV